MINYVCAQGHIQTVDGPCQFILAKRDTSSPIRCSFITRPEQTKIRLTRPAGKNLENIKSPSL